uniref:Uncharacterized protein n=1 Tax=Rhizophora mucronata TaxID=61149 RepID=A0A2P2J1Y4_RHIMU
MYQSLLTDEVKIQTTKIERSYLMPLVASQISLQKPEPGPNKISEKTTFLSFSL